MYVYNGGLLYSGERLKYEIGPKINEKVDFVVL